MTDSRDYTDLTEAYRNSSFPCNPIPFAIGLADMVRDRGTDAIRSDDAKKILWVLIGQAYGQLAKVDMPEEYLRLYYVKDVEELGDEA